MFSSIEQLERQGTVEYILVKKSENLIVGGETYGKFSVFIFVLKERSGVGYYVDNKHPIIITLTGDKIMVK